MVPVKERAGPGFKILAVLTIVFFLALVAGLITTYDTDLEVAAVAPPAAAATDSAEVAAQAPPVGAVASGGGGMAGDGAGPAMPVFVGLVALTMLATAGIVVRRRSLTPV